MAILISNIKELVGIHANNNVLRGTELAHLPSIKNAYVIVEGEQVASFGKMEELDKDVSAFSSHYNAAGKMVLPSWCDSHTHLVFAGSREGEFIDKIKGLSYADIAAKGGGILNSAKRLNETS